MEAIKAPMRQVGWDSQIKYITMALAILGESGYDGPLFREDQYPVVDPSEGGMMSWYITFYLSATRTFIEALDDELAMLIGKIPGLSYNDILISFEQHPDYKES